MAFHLVQCPGTTKSGEKGRELLDRIRDDRFEETPGEMKAPDEAVDLVHPGDAPNVMEHVDDSSVAAALAGHSDHSTYALVRATSEGRWES
jgi:hypothetical protein